MNRMGDRGFGYPHADVAVGLVHGGTTLLL